MKLKRGEAAAAFAILLAAVPAAASEQAGGFSLLGSFLQMIASLVLVVGVIFLFSHFAGRWMKHVTPGGGSRYIRIVETRHLGPKKSLMLVEVGGEYLLLGNSPEGMQFLKQVDMLEEIEVVGSPDTAWAPAVGGDKVREFFSKLSTGLWRPVGKKC